MAGLKSDGNMALSVLVYTAVTMKTGTDFVVLLYSFVFFSAFRRSFSVGVNG
jgi:hypothetical protein